MHDPEQIDAVKRQSLDGDDNPAQTAKTMIHEAAHALMPENITYTEYIEHRGIKETEAESVAYIGVYQRMWTGC